MMLFLSPTTAEGKRAEIVFQFNDGLEYVCSNSKIYCFEILLFDLKFRLKYSEFVYLNFLQVLAVFYYKRLILFTTNQI